MGYMYNSTTKKGHVVYARDAYLFIITTKFNIPLLLLHGILTEKKKNICRV